MKRTIKQQLALGGLGLISTALLPAFAVNLPGEQAPESASVTENLNGGSGLLIPLMAADTRMHELATLDAPANGGAPAGQPVDDIQFVRQATESARMEISSAQEALPQLKSPQLKQVAQMLVSDHGAANERLSQDRRGEGLAGARSARAGGGPVRHGEQ